MLDAICSELNNYFDTHRYHGEFIISGGKLVSDLPLADGQYVRIMGSMFNDGVHKHLDGTELTDETFTGSVWAMAVPPAVIALTDEIAEWIVKYEQQSLNPFQSESFGGYSYNKKTSGSSLSGNVVVGDTWQAIFRNKLNKYRKLPCCSDGGKP